MSKIVLDCERMKYPNTGLYHYLLQLGQALQKERHEEELCFFTPASVQQIFGAGACYLKQSSLHKLRLPSLPTTSLWHATHQGTHYFPYRHPGPVVLTIHDLNFLYDDRKRNFRKQSYLKSLQKMIKRADALTCISSFTKNEVLKHLDVGSKPIEVIYNGCNISANVETKAPGSLPSAPFLFTIGMGTPKKNLHVLPALLQHNTLLLLMAGSTPNSDYKNQIIREAKKLGVSDRVFFLGNIPEEEKNWYYQNCLAFVFPSLSEGFGLPVIEAMYFGKPVFLSTRTSLPEIGGDEAYYFSSFDPAVMQNVLTEGLHHYQKINPSEKIKARARLFNWQQAAKHYWQVYRQLI